MEFAMNELEQYVEGHLDGDGFAGVMTTCDENGRTILGWLVTRLKPYERNITTFITLTKASDLDYVRELLSKLLNNYHTIMVAVMVTETRNEQFMLHLITELLALHHLLCE